MVSDRMDAVTIDMVPGWCGAYFSLFPSFSRVSERLPYHDLLYMVQDEEQLCRG